jgi:hypothetical protein
MALPSSRVTPMKTCPALRPRWCPERIALARSGLLPSAPLHGVGFPPSFESDYPNGPRPYRFRGSITRPAFSLPPAPHTPLLESHAVSLLTGWLGFGQVDSSLIDPHPLGNNNQFHGLSPNSKVSDLPWHE